MSTKQRRRDVKKNDKNLEREGLSAIFYNASKNLYLKRKVRKQVLDPPLHVKVVLYIFFFRSPWLFVYFIFPSACTWTS